MSFVHAPVIYASNKTQNKNKNIKTKQTNDNKVNN